MMRKALVAGMKLPSNMATKQVTPVAQNMHGWDSVSLVGAWT